MRLSGNRGKGASYPISEDISKRLTFCVFSLWFLSKTKSYRRHFFRVFKVEISLIIAILCIFMSYVLLGHI